MNFTTRKKASVFLLILALLMLATQTPLVAATPPPLPNPIVIFLNQVYYEQGGKQWTRYNLLVTNYRDYPNEMFAAAPRLPPCGKNTSAARTWVDIYASNGQRIYGFCAVGSHDDLTKLWFSIETSVIPPSWVYVVLNDRQTGQTYKSNLVETTE